jgi:hypothetical protein
MPNAQPLASNTLRLTIEALTHAQSGRDLGSLADYLRGYAGDTGMWGHVLEHDTAGTDLGTFADLHIAEDLGSRSE